MPTPSLSPEDRLLPLLDKLRRLDADAPPSDGLRISAPQVSLLSAVAASQGASLQALAGALGLAPPTVCVAVSRLAAMGLLERRPDPYDHRAIQIYLTERGDAVYRRTLASRRARAASLLAPLPPDDRRRLVDLLNQALASVSGPPSPPDPPRLPRGIAAFLRRVRAFGRAVPRG
jgi:MarR family transcriptional regulator, lower aerobic nicotinate degradation pathway regulator